MDERTETAVSNQNIALRQFGMQNGSLGHIVRTERSSQHFDNKTGSCMKERQHVGHWETTARPLTSRLAKNTPKFERVGHAEGRSIGIKRSMSVPSFVAVDRWL